MISRKHIPFLGTLASMFVAIAPAQASTEYGLTIAATGSQSLGYIRFTSGASTSVANCPNAVVYIDLTQEAGKVKMSIAITAKASNRTISRIDYHNDGSHCWVDLLEI